MMAVWVPCIIRSVLLILLNSRTSKLQLQPDLTTIRESQPLENPQMTTNRESQSPISALDSETRVTATDFLVFALSLCGNLSTLPLIAKVRKSPYFKPFSRYLPHFLDSRTTVSTWFVFGNISTGWIFFTLYPCCTNQCRSRASVSGLHET